MKTISLKITLTGERTYWTKNKEEAEAFATFVNRKASLGYTGIYFIYL